MKICINMKQVLVALFTVFLAVPLWAQESIVVEAPNLVAQGEQFNVTFVIEGDNAPSNFIWDSGPDFQIVWGPQKGSSTSIQILNGKRSKTSQTTYTYILLPKASGRFSIPTATATIKGKTISSKSVAIEVVPEQASSQSQQGGTQGKSSNEASSTGNISSEDMFLKLSLSRSSVVIGEPVTAVLKLCSRVNISGFDAPKFPTFNGFWSQEVEAPTNIQFQRENIDNRIYDVATLRKWVLIPQQAGTITIDPAELVCLVNIRSSSRGNSIFDSFFDDYTTIRKRLTTGQLSVKVSNLPAGAPASFGGGVGSFTVSSKLSKDSLKTHEAASVILTVSGKGNVSLLTAPTVVFPPDFDVYDVKISENTSVSDGKTSGSKVFEYPFIPRSHGDFVIPSVEYSYYDVNSGKYVTLGTEPMRISVLKGASSEVVTPQTGNMIVSTSRRDVKSLGSDVRYIHTKTPSFRSAGSFFCGSYLFWAIAALILLAGIVTVIALRKVAAMRADVAGNRNRKATRMARSRLALAGTFLSKNLYTAFYEELHKAMLGFISDKLNMDMSDMSKENISAELEARGVPKDSVKILIDLLDACEFARYAPDSGHEAMNSHYQAALKAISSIDSLMKSKKTTSGPVGAAMLTLLVLLSSPYSRATESREFLDSLWNEGIEAYAKGDWQQAISSWTAIYEAGVESEELFYNIGNAFFKIENYPQSILWYERALKQNPSHSDARNNLELANQLTQDRIDSVPEFVLSSWARKICWWLNSNSWAILFLVFLAAAVGMALVFLLGRRTGIRKMGFYTSIVLLILSFICLGFAYWQKADYFKADSAIVIRPVSSVKSSPSDDAMSKDLFVLHEGTKIKILDEVGSWKNIELTDGRQGWIPSADLEVI